MSLSSQNSRIDSSRTDIIIVGGGMVGLAAAAALVDSDLQVTLIEQSDLTSLTSQDWLSENIREKEAFDIRVSAINPENQRWLSTLKAWQNIPFVQQAGFEKMAVWDGDGSGHIEFDAADIAQPILGTIVENQVLRAALYQQLVKASNIRLVSHNEVTTLENMSDVVFVTLTNGEHLRAKLLIGADGANSSIRRQLGIGNTEQSYQQQAFVANVITEKPHDDTAWQRFTASGPVAFLPLPHPNLCSVVWSLDESKASLLKSCTTDEFGEQLAKAFEFKLGSVNVVSQVRAFPLSKRHSENYLTQRCALVGDAAHTIHPLAGQGVNLGFQDVVCLVKQILKQHHLQRDFGLSANLRPFERERKLQNYLMQNAMTGFKELFSQQNLPVTLLRNYAMSRLNQIGFAKQLFMRYAMGQ